MFERIDGAFADAAGRRVDDAQQRDRVIRILDDFQIRDQVFDLGALVERKSADHVIFQAVAAHGFFKQPRLRVGAVEHGGARSFAASAAASRRYFAMWSAAKRASFSPSGAS